MSDIRRREGNKGVTYQVRYPSASTKTGYAYKTFRTMKEARAFLESGEAYQRGNRPASAVRTVPEALEHWLAICEKEGRSGRDPVTKFTAKTYRYRADIINAYIWEKEIQDLAPPDIVNFRSWLLRNYSRDLSRKVLSSFHSMVIEMVSRGILQYDIVSGVQINSGSRYDEAVTIPTEAEVRALLAAADRLANSKNQQTMRTWRRYRPMLYLAVDSGMRPQEYICLASYNIHDTGVVVDRAVERGSNTISVTKTPSGRRLIDLSAHTVEMVRFYSDNHSTPNQHDLVFPTSTGKLQSLDNWRKRGFAAACQEAGLMREISKDGRTYAVPKYTPYNLRHFYASMLIEKRVNLKKIQYLMGHSDIQTTLNIYGHVIERVEGAAERPITLIDEIGH